MSLFDLTLPPGVYGNGTALQARGRWRDCSLMRTRDNSLLPVGGWQAHSASAVTGKARAILTWKDNNNNALIAIGTHSHLYAMSRSGVLSDITPVGYTAGRASATMGGGYGQGPYGVGTYGTPRPDTVTVQDATVWTLDTRGENLVGMNAEDGIPYEWALDTGTPAEEIANAPQGRALVVTNERILMVLGARSPRGIDWSDADDFTEWTPGPTTLAGKFDLQTAGRLMCGKRLTGQTGIWTDVDFWTADYLDETLLYSFERKGSGCGAISQQSVAVVDATTVWMSQNGFYTYNGFVQALECEVFDRVFADINRTQASKVHAVHNSTEGEVWWFYPSAAANENDCYVFWNYRNNHWMVGTLSRLCGTDRGTFKYPLWVGDDGVVYEHETGFAYPGADAPFATSGPVQIGNGDNVAYAMKLIADEKTRGDVQVSFQTRFYPNGPATSYGPYALTSTPTNLRFCGRQIEMTITGVVGTDWRWGSPRLDLRAGGGR